MSARNLIYSGTLKASIICLIATVWIAPTLGAEPPTAAFGGRNDENIPHLRRKGNAVQLIVDGKPFIILGGQVGNASAFPHLMEQAWPKLKAFHANTVEFPVYWEVIEPEPGRFDFTALDQIIRATREQGLRAILLWFGTWKNGTMDYVPAWVKSDPARFPRVLDAAGKPMRVLSPHSPANLEADRKAFTALMKHVREIDEAHHTVIIVQVENEPGLYGSVRDFSPEANRLFNGPVPASLVTALKKKPGTWKEVFGSRLAEEVFTVYHLATYINEVARAGKQAYPLPMIVNVWMGGEGTNDRFHEFDRPGESYPSGGAVSHMLDIWKVVAPDIDIIAPDIYHRSPIIYQMILSRYHRPDNPLLVPETGGGMAFARYFFYGLADYSAIGFAVFGIDYGPSSEMGQQFSDMGANFRVIESALPVIAELQGTEKLKVAVEEDSIPGRMLYFDRYDILVRFRPPGRRPSPPTVPAGPSVPSGRVLVGQLGPDEFLIMGFDAAIDFKPPIGSEYTAAQFLLVEVGLYDENGVWKPMELLNGDLTTSGLIFPLEGAMIRVKLMRY
jgi:hypothetical protein